MKTILEKLPLIGTLAGKKGRRSDQGFSGSSNYWEQRYASGGNSGDGSYRLLAEFKAEVINAFVTEHNISSVIEFGCGDGNQLALANYAGYLGFDVSETVLNTCRAKFAGSADKEFSLMSDYQQQRAELSLSLDVIYHLVEDDIYSDYMHKLFDAAERFVIVYASNTDENPVPRPAHVKHRCFARWLETNKPEWTPLQHIPNRYPYNPVTRSGSFADFYIYSKNSS